MVLGIGHIKRIAEHIQRKPFFAKRFERKAASALSSKDEHEIARAFQKLSEGRLAHHTRNLFTNDKLSTEERVKLYQASAMAGADKYVLMQGFTETMKRATPTEKNAIVYPKLLKGVKYLKGVQHATTCATMRGWISSCSTITDLNHKLAQDVLELPPSARG